MTGSRLLIIDDEPDIARFVGQVAEGLGYEVSVTTDAEAFKQQVEAFAPDVVIMDIVMPEVDGIELVKFLAETGSSARVLVMSGYAERYLNNTKTLGEAFGLKSVTAMAKPIELPKLEAFLSAP
ncbi:MAG: response regulator [Alphaproteobacteria bacterium]|nr:response regulator [Alphaproteobacteria bacterium]